MKEEQLIIFEQRTIPAFDMNVGSNSLFVMGNVGSNSLFVMGNVGSNSLSVMGM